MAKKIELNAKVNIMVARRDGDIPLNQFIKSIVDEFQGKDAPMDLVEVSESIAAGIRAGLVAAYPVVDVSKKVIEQGFAAKWCGNCRHYTCEIGCTHSKHAQAWDEKVRICIDWGTGGGQ